MNHPMGIARKLEVFASEDGANGLSTCRTFVRLEDDLPIWTERTN